MDLLSANQMMHCGLPCTLNFALTYAAVAVLTTAASILCMHMEYVRKDVLVHL